MSKILIVEDEERMRKVVKNYLMKNNFDVIEAEDGREGIDKFYEENPDLVILDIMIPKIDGWTVCREIRKDSIKPILMLTARSSETDEVFGFELGADDYLKKPFSLSVLLARIKVLLSRKKIEIEKQMIGNITLDEMARKIYYKNEEIILAPKEYELLVYLIKNKGIALSREQILTNIWEYDYFGDLRTVDSHIKKLRKKLEGNYIETVRGYGYRFEV